MGKLSRASLVILILFMCVGCDQASKHLVREHVAPGQSQSWFGDTLRLTHVENPGAFLGLGASLTPAARVAVFQVGVGVLIVGLLAGALFAPRAHARTAGALALLAASGIGNLIDRVLQDGSVTDFLNVGIGSLRTGIFNVADMAGVAGVLLLLLARAPSPSREPEP